MPNGTHLVKAKSLHRKINSRDHPSPCPFSIPFTNTNSLYLCFFSLISVVPLEDKYREKILVKSCNKNGGSKGCSGGCRCAERKSGDDERVFAEEPINHRHGGLDPWILRPPPLGSRDRHATHTGPLSFWVFDFLGITLFGSRETLRKLGKREST